MGFLDLDDCAYQTMFEKMYNFEKTKNLDMVICDLCFVYSKKILILFLMIVLKLLMLPFRSINAIHRES